jgi:hypothetical protein
MRIAKYLFSFLIVLVFSLCASAQTTVVPDTTFLLRETKGDVYHAIFIDTAKASLYYDYITTFQFDEIDSASYQASLDCMGILSFMKYNDFGLPKQWNLLYTYKNAYYLYSPSDYVNNYRILISDSTYTDYYGTGPFAHKINSLTKINNKTYTFDLSSCNDIQKKVIIHIIDPQKGIAIFEDPAADKDDRYVLMVRTDKAKEFPIIVNFSPQKEAEYKFDEPDYEQLLK